MATLEPVPSEVLETLLTAAGLAPAAERFPLPADDLERREEVRLADGSGVVLLVTASPTEKAALEALADHPLNGEFLLASEGNALLLERRAFEPLGAGAGPEAYGRLGTALGAFHREWKGREPSLPLHDAAWFSRSAPYVLAEVAAQGERGEYALSLAEFGRLEEAGVQMAELAEPLTGLLPTFVHGACSPERAGFAGGRPVLVGWGFACAGLGWLDLARLAMGAMAAGQPALVALVGSYAEAADYEPTVVGDLAPFCLALHDLYVLDRWNRELGSGARASGSLRERGQRRVRRLLDLIGA